MPMLEEDPPSPKSIWEFESEFDYLNNEHASENTFNRLNVEVNRLNGEHWDNIDKLEDIMGQVMTLAEMISKLVVKIKKSIK